MANTNAGLLKKWLPHLQAPIIISAPMLGVANAVLAANVTKAGGLGMVPGGYDLAPGSAQLTALDSELSTARAALGLEPGAALPVGVGFICCTADFEQQFAGPAVAAVLARYRPAAVWLFAPPPGGRGFAGLVAAARAAHPAVRVFAQVGTVADARAAALAGVDVVVAQGVDAGGHQYAAGCGVVALVPEVRDMLDRDFAAREIALVAAGGIADARAVVAALALGAEAAVMGTRFLVADEASNMQWQKDAILKTEDGGATTAKSTFHDQLRGTDKVWPPFYDGRAIINDSYRDHLRGMALEENKKKLSEAAEAGDSAQRGLVWSGAAVGLVRQAGPAADIVRQTRDEARARIKALQSSV